MKILVLSQYFSPDIVAGAFRVTETVELLRKKRHDVRVVTAKPHRAQVEGAKILAAEDSVYRVPLVGYGKGGKYRYIMHYLSFMVTAILGGLLHGGRPDIVLATSPSLFVGVSGWLVARLKGSRFVLDIRDIWPDSAVTTGHLSPNGRITRLARTLERWLYRRADLITCVATPMAEYIQAYVPHKRIVVIYNGVQEKFLERPKTVETGRLISLDPGKINIVYLGNLGYCQALGMVAEAARRLQEAGDNRFCFYLIGGGVESQLLSDLQKNHQLKNLVLPGLVPKDEALRLVHQASALFLQLKEDPTMEKTIPSKVFDYMVSGKPILFGIEGEGKAILGSVSGNLSFVPNALQSFMGALAKLADDYTSLTIQAEENRVLVAEYTRERMVDKLAEELKRL